MLDILSKHLSDTDEPSYCAVYSWIKTLTDEEQAVMAELKSKDTKVVLVKLYEDLNAEVKLPFKITVFRAHMRGYCVCPRS